MIGESLAIVLILLVMAFLYRRSGKGGVGALALPLVCVPLAWLASTGLLGLPDQEGGNLLYLYISVVAGLVATVAFCMVVARSIPNKTARMGYLTFSFIFSGALVVAYILL